MKKERHKYCPNCGDEFVCGTCNKGLTCWCAALPNIEIIERGGQCLCPECLKEVIQKKVEIFVEDVKAGKAENTAPKYKGNEQRLIEGIDYYMENGNLVFSAWYHLKRGECCGNNCRHCPYDHKNVKQ